MEIGVSLDLYKVFCSVVKTESMSLAAKELFISQPAVSMAIKQLEAKFGKSLLIRLPKGIKPTTEGLMLYGYLNQALSLISNAEKKFVEMQNLSMGEIRISASDSVLANYLWPFIEKYTVKYPKINIKITNTMTNETIKLLRKGQVDIGFVNMPFESDDLIESAKCFALHDCLIGGQKYKHLSDQGIGLKEISDYPLLILDTGSNTRKNLDDYAQENGVVLLPTIELGSNDLIVQFTKINLGLSFCVREYYENQIDGKTLFEIPLSPPPPERHVGMIKLKNVELSYAAERFADMLFEKES